MKLHLQMFAPDPTYYRGQHELAKFNATGPSTVTSADILPTNEKGLIVLDVTSVVGTPSIAIYFDTYDQVDGVWIPENNGTALATEAPTSAATYEIPVGPNTSNAMIIVGDRARVRFVITGAGASITGNAVYIETDTEGGD